jgi:dermatan/chondrotin sulfate uronyl 2-O-sulfotransferase UST
MITVHYGTSNINPFLFYAEYTPFNATLNKAKRIIYNRVPKCGSSAVESVLRHLAVLNGFTYYRSKLFRDPVIEEGDQLALAKKLASIPPPYIYDRHIHFLDLSK